MTATTPKYTRFFHDGTREPSIALIDREQLLLENEDFEDFVDAIDSEIATHGFYDDSDPSNHIVCIYMGGWPEEGD